MTRSSALLLGAVLLSFGAIREAQADTPRDSLVVAFETKPRSVDPRLVGGDANSQYLEELLFLPLISFDDRGGLKPVIAESYQADGKNGFKVKLRKGMHFANGHPITADDVIATYERIVSTSATPPSPRKGAFDKLSAVKKISENEVEFLLKAPDAAFLTNLNVGILPKDAIASEPNQVFGKGYESGPYTVEKSEDAEWVLKRNAKYAAAPFGGAMPKLERVVFKIIGDSGTRYAALVKGDLDLVQNSLDADKIVEIQKGNKFNVATGTSLSTTYLAFNFRNPRLKNPAVRRAIAMGINRDEILKYSLQGLGIKATSMFPAGNTFFESSIKEIPYDPAGAKKLLASAGYGSTPLRFSIKVTTQKERISTAKAIAGQLKRIGVIADVQALESGTFSKQLAEGNVETWLSPWTGFKDGDHLRFVFHSKQMPPDGANRGAYSNTKVDELLSAAVEELDLKKRLPLYSEAQKIIAEDLPYVFLWHKKNVVVTQKKVKGFHLYADGRYVSLTEVTKD